MALSAVFGTIVIIKNIRTAALVTFIVGCITISLIGWSWITNMMFDGNFFLCKMKVLILR